MRIGEGSDSHQKQGSAEGSEELCTARAHPGAAKELTAAPRRAGSRPAVCNCSCCYKKALP